MSRRKSFLVLLSAVFAVGSIFLGVQYSNKSNRELVGEVEQDKTSSKDSKKSKDANKKETAKKITAISLFLDSDKVFLATNINDDQLSKVRKEIKGNASEQQIFDEAEEKWKVLKEVNQLFDGNVLKGKEVQKATLKKDVNASDIERVSSIINDKLKEDGFSKKLLAIINEDNTETEDLSSLDFESNSDIAYAKSLVDGIVKNGEVITGFTMEGYQNANGAVQALIDSPEKTYLQEQIKKVEDAMTAMGITY